MMKQRPETNTSEPADAGLRRTLATALLVAAPSAFAYDDATHAATGQTGFWFIGLMVAFVAVIFAGFWLHAREERPSPGAEQDTPPKPDTARRAAPWPKRQGESR